MPRVARRVNNKPRDPRNVAQPGHIKKYGPILEASSKRAGSEAAADRQTFTMISRAAMNEVRQAESPWDFRLSPEKRNNK